MSFKDVEPLKEERVPQVKNEVRWTDEPRHSSSNVVTGVSSRPVDVGDINREQNPWQPSPRDRQLFDKHDSDANSSSSVAYLSTVGTSETAESKTMVSILLL